MRDVVTGGILAAAMLALLLESRGLPAPRYEPLGAVFLARLVPGAVLAGSLALLARGAWSLRARSVPAGPEGAFDRPAAAGALAAMFGWAGLMQAGVPFLPSAIAYMVVTGLVLGVPRRPAPLAMLTLAATLTALIFRTLFAGFLDVTLP